jgi:CDP-glucose 4,6-dehydratase
MVINTSFWNHKKVLITGHTGFKGSWLSLLLKQFGAEVFGYALDPPTSPSMYELANIDGVVHSVLGDVRDYDLLQGALKNIEPEIVIHMAAQALVKESYRNPIDTYSTNVMGTVHVLEACRQTSSVKAIVNVTTDKCYENQEWCWGYRENEPMGGYDPYSSSKGCSELVTSAYRKSYFGAESDGHNDIALASARAGNVIGGGDWAADRLIPDFIRAISQNKKIKIRSPYAVRPWQHVLEPLSGYLGLAEKLYVEGRTFAGPWNFGPEDQDAKNVEWITKTLCELWGGTAQYEIDNLRHHHEANYLKLDCSKAKAELDWCPKWDIQAALASIVEWNKSLLSGVQMRTVTERQIQKYFSSTPV